MKFDDLIVNINDSDQSFQINDSSSVFTLLKMTPKQVLMESMASCHGLAIVNNKLIGDPLEIKMFEATNYTLDDINSKVIS